jgi:pimeloyl-ACP methyl ester carboxylesterase
MDGRCGSVLALLIVVGLMMTAVPALAQASDGDGPHAEALPPVQYAPVNNVTLAYRSFGSGEPLLLICGFGATMDQWNSTFVSLLAAQYRVITYDHRGMGYSSYGSTPSSIQQYADDAAALIHYLGYSSANTYGTSMGSTVSQQLVISHPDAVRKMTLSSATYSIHIPECTLLLDLIEYQATNMNQTQGVRDEATANLNWSGSWDLLPTIQNHILLIVGTADLLTPDPVSVQIASQINGSWVMRFTDIPHSGQSYAPVQYAQGVLTFLAMNEAPYQTTVPDAPTGLCAAESGGRVQLQWTPPMYNGNSSILSYSVYRSTSAAGPFLRITSVAGTWYNDTEVENGRNYWYKVSASNAMGQGMSSAVLEAVPQGGVSGSEMFGAVVLILVLIATVAIVVAATRRK